MAEPTDEEVNENGIAVVLPSGVSFVVLTEAESAYVAKRVSQYTDEFRWTNVSDFQDVDRIIILELLVYRYGIFVSKMKDYFGDTVDEIALRKTIHDYSGEIRQLKKSLAMDRVARDKSLDEDTVASYLEKLRIRAKEFGINRDNMTAKAVELGQQVIALWQLHVNCTPDERLEMQCTAEDLVKWLGDVFKPEFEAVDKHFRETNQKIWIADM